MKACAQVPALAWNYYIAVESIAQAIALEHAAPSFCTAPPKSPAAHGLSRPVPLKAEVSDAGPLGSASPISDIPHTRRVRAALQRELPARAAVGTIDGGPTYVERATEGTGCPPAKLERAIDCMRLIAGRIDRPPLGISVICERCLHRWLFSCSVAALWWSAEARLRLCDEDQINYNRKSSVTVVTSSRARSCTSDTTADLSLLRVAVPEAPSCKWIDLAQNHFLTPRASPSAGWRRLTTGQPQEAVKTAQKSTLYPPSRLLYHARMRATARRSPSCPTAPASIFRRNTIIDGKSLRGPRAERKIISEC